MNGWGRGVGVGFILGLLLAAVFTRSTAFEMFARIGTDGRLLLDGRGDESTVGRVRNLPVAVLGEAAFAKRSWLVVTTYDFTLRLQPDVAPALAGAVGSSEVAVTLPGRVRTSNAPRMSEGTALWDTLPEGPLRVQTRTVHWGRLVLTAIIIAALLLLGRGGKSGG